VAIAINELNTVMTEQIQPGVVDGYFKAGPLIAMMRSRFTRRWTGHTIQDTFMYRPMKGGAYAKGGAFDVSRHRTRAAIQFTPRYYQVNVTEFLEDLEVEMAGPNQAFSTLRTDMAQAALTMSAILEIAALRHGQNIVGDDRSLEINGIPEALNDGVTASYAGNVFPSYGGQTRADVAPALTPPTGLVPANVAAAPYNGQTSYRVLYHSWITSGIGNERPTIGLTTRRMMGFIAETFLPHQQIDTLQPEIAWPGIKFNQATIMHSDYCPGADGVNDAFLGNYNNPTETFFWLNFGPTGDDAYIRLYIAASSKFAFGFTGFKGAREDNQISGQILFGGNLVMRNIRLSRVLHGFSS
jgi:hypothetical protein